MSEAEIAALRARIEDITRRLGDLEDRAAARDERDRQFMSRLLSALAAAVIGMGTYIWSYFIHSRP